MIFLDTRYIAVRPERGVRVVVQAKAGREDIDGCGDIAARVHTSSQHASVPHPAAKVPRRGEGEF